MAVPFSRSMRSLQGDSYGISLAMILIACGLLVGWFWWLLFAQIPLYVISHDWALARHGTLDVRVPIESMSSVRPGQPATLEVQSKSGGVPRRVKAIVADVPSRTHNRLAPGTVRVALLDGMPSGATGGDVRITVKHVSPLTLLVHTNDRLVQGR